MTASGHIAFVLHAHLPFVRHPDQDDFLEERWLFEALTECYLPLLDVLEGLEHDHVQAQITLSISPTLLAMWHDPLLREHYRRHLDRCCEVASRETHRTRRDPARQRLAQDYLHRFRQARDDATEGTWRGDLVARLRALQDAGQIELITTAATHALLPLLRPLNHRRVQLEIAAAEYRRFFGRAPSGVWLPECGYDEAIDHDVHAAGFRYAVLDAHGIEYGTPRPVYGVYAPVMSPAGLALFGRDVVSATQVWSARDGYPADPWYRDFHRDLGTDEPTATAPLRGPTGIKYHRITGPTETKALYDPDRAAERITIHAEHFVAARLAQLQQAAAHMNRPPVIVCPYDAELFGHWWHEGPGWLNAVLRRFATVAERSTTTLAQAVHTSPVLQALSPSPSTWGEHGYQRVWLQEATDWIYPALHSAGDRLQALCHQFPGAADATRRALTQALRELLLAQASDWPFMLSRATTATYATARVNTHLERFARLCLAVEQDTLDLDLLESFETTDNLFPSLDYRILL